MSEFRKWREAWHVPADGSPLKSAHLRALALGAVATAAAGIGRLGWGLALPPGGGTGPAAAGAINKMTLSGGKVVATDLLSVVLPEGVYVALDRASAPLPERGGGVLGMVYTLPAHAEAGDRPAPIKPSLACFADEETAAAAGATVLAEIRSVGRGKRRSLRWLAPTLEIGAAPESAAAADALGKAMLDAADAAGARQRYKWQAVAAALRLSAAQPPETPVEPFNREVARALGVVVALARGEPDDAVEEPALKAAVALAQILDVTPGAAALPEALAAWYKKLASLLDRRGPLMAWLRGRGAERQRLPEYPKVIGIGRRLDRFDVAGAESVKLRLRLHDRAAPAVRVRVDDAPFDLVLDPVPGGFASVLSLRGKAQHLDLELPAEVDAEIRETVGDGEYRS